MKKYIKLIVYKIFIFVNIYLLTVQNVVLLLPIDLILHQKTNFYREKTKQNYMMSRPKYSCVSEGKTTTNISSYIITTFINYILTIS